MHSPILNLNALTYSKKYLIPSELRAGRRRAPVRWCVSLSKHHEPGSASAIFSINAQWQGNESPNSDYLFDRDDRNKVPDQGELLLALHRRGMLRGKDTLLPSLLPWDEFSLSTDLPGFVAAGRNLYRMHLTETGALPCRKGRLMSPSRTHFQWLKQHVCLGAFDGDALPPPPEFPPPTFQTPEALHEWMERCALLAEDTITPWLTARYTRLRPAFTTAMVQWFGPQILRPTTLTIRSTPRTHPNPYFEMFERSVPCP